MTNPPVPVETLTQQAGSAYANLWLGLLMYVVPKTVKFATGIYD